MALVIAAVTYGPANVGTYGRLDDYGYVVSSRTGTLEGLRFFYLDSGRPVPALVMTVLAPQVTTVEGLVWFRWASTVMIAMGAAAAAFMTFRLAAPARVVTASVLAACAAGAALSTTASPSTATWAILAGSAYAFPAAMVAGILATSSMRLWWIPSAGLVFVTAFSYQQVTPIAVLAPLLWTTERWAGGRPAQWSRSFVVGGIAVLALAADYALVKVRDGTGTSRISEVSTGERVRWFTSEFVPRTLDVAVPTASTTLTWSVVLLALLLLTPILAGPRYLACSAAVVVAWAGTALVVLPVELWASHRLASAAQFVVWVGAAACFSIGVSRVRWKVLRGGAAVAGAALASYALVVAGHRATNYLALPNEVDWSATTCLTERTDIGPDSRLLLNDFGSSVSPIIDKDEYGIIATSVPWAIGPEVWLAEAATDGADPDFAPYDLEVVAVGGGATGGLVVPQDASC